MNEINKEEMFGTLKSFLKSKGIDVQEGSYAEGIRKGCDILTDTVNLSQRAFDKAKGAVEKGVDQVRQTVHERTAPKAKAQKPAKQEAPASGANQPRAKAAGKGTSATTKAASAKRGPKRGK